MCDFLLFFSVVDVILFGHLVPYELLCMYYGAELLDMFSLVTGCRPKFSPGSLADLKCTVEELKCTVEEQSDKNDSSLCKGTQRKGRGRKRVRSSSSSI